MDRSNKAYRIALCGVMFAVIFVSFMLDKGISIALPVSMALFALTATFAMMMLYNNWAMAILAGVFMGMASMLKEVIFPGVSFQYVVNPLVSVLPRVMMAIAGFAGYRLTTRLCRNVVNKYTRQTLAITVGVLIGLVVNTILFLTALNICKQLYGVDTDSVFVIIKAVVYTNIIPEYIVSLIAVPHIVIGSRKGLKLGIEADKNIVKE